MAIANLKIKTFQISYVVLTEDALDKIAGLMEELFTQLKGSQLNHLTELLFEIRSRDEMYSGADKKSFLKVFEDEKEAEFVQIILLNTEQATGTLHCRVTLHVNKNGSSFFEATGTDENFTISSLDKFKKILKNVPKRNQVIHSPWTEMSVQLLAVFLIVGLSYYLANAVFSTFIPVDRVYLFVAIFLLFSNLWTYISRGLLFIRNQFYPKVDIRSKPRTRWIPGILAFAGTSAGAWLLERLLDMLATSKTP